MSFIGPKEEEGQTIKAWPTARGPKSDVGPPPREPSQLVCALPPRLEDLPPADMLEEFREWIKKGVLKKTQPG